MTRIFLIGYMGAGKTTLGRALAGDLGLEFIDMDFYIEQRHHSSISGLFARHGEEGFRQIERQVLHEVGEFEDIIISCGGGTPCFFDNMDYMNRQGDTVLLDVPIDVLVRRLAANRSKRPVLAGKSDEELRGFIAGNLETRMPYYSRARHVFPAARLESREEIAESVARFRAQLGIPNGKTKTREVP